MLNEDLLFSFAVFQDKNEDSKDFIFVKLFKGKGIFTKLMHLKSLFGI